MNKIRKAERQNESLKGRKRRPYKELVDPIWAFAFVEAVYEITGCQRFTYITAVTRLKGSAEPWECHEGFRRNIGGNPIKILTLQEMLSSVVAAITETPAASSLGRTLQLMVAAGWKGEPFVKLGVIDEAAADRVLEQSEDD